MNGSRIKDQDLFGVHDLDGDEVFVDVTTGEDVEQDATVAESVEGITAATTLQISKDELTLAQTLMEFKAAKPKAKGVTIQEPTFEKKDQITLDEEVARKLEAEMKAEMDEEERIAREKNEANRAIIKEWDDGQATIDADRHLAEQIQAQEREQLSIEERSKLLAEIIKSRRNLKKTQAEVTEGSSKRAGQKLEQESAKKQKLVEQEQAKVADDDTAELKRCLDIVHEDDDDVEIEATPLSSKSPTIVDYKIYREGKKREDLEVLRSIVKERFKKTKPVDDMDTLLFQTLKTMFEPHVEDIIWKYQQGAV
uniref:Uncharacterized protein n=1 Tax=Tanacetum cinerariifolium TaxID=118510 RepID=A0A6L2KXY8_TANCI|nr:hypothetical protein [Tanacetum cinerariifolium]